MILAPMAPRAAARALQGLPRGARGDLVWEMTAVWSQETFGDGVTVPMARFQPGPGEPARGRLPVLEMEDGQSGLVILHNQLTVAVQPSILGHADGAAIPPGQVGVFPMRAPPPGTWLLTERSLGPVAGSLGLGAVLISRPRQQPTEPEFNAEYTLLYHDTDSRWNRDVWNGIPPDTSTFEPDYFTANGLEFPALSSDPDSALVCRVGDRVLLRMGNLGLVRQSIHFHGYHVEVLTRNGRPETMLPAKDTVALPAGTTVELLLPVTQPGAYPVHPHFVPAVTANGLYPFGQLTLIQAS